MKSKSLVITPHYFYIVKLIYPYLTLLIIPVFKGALGYLTGNKQKLPDFFTAELFLLILIFMLSYAKLKRVKMIFSKKITVSRGLFCKTVYEISENALKLIVVESNPLLRRFGIYRLKIYTEAGKKVRPDEDIPITKSDAVKICMLYNIGENLKKCGSNRSNILMAAASSSVTAGLLIAAPIVKSVAGVFGDEMESLVPSFASKKWLIDKLPNITFWVSGILFVGYLISFVVIVLRNYEFKSDTDGKKITLDGGIFPHRTVFCNSNSVTALTILSPPIMRSVKKCIVKFSACGYGKTAGELGVLMPSVSAVVANERITYSLPQFSPLNKGIKPNKRALGRCCFLPIVCVLIIILLGKILSNKFPYINSVISLVSVIVGTLSLIYIAVRVDVLFNGGFSCCDGKVTVKARNRLSSAIFTVGVKKIERYKIYRTPFDKRLNVCRIKVQAANKSKDKIILPYVPYEKIKELILCKNL